MYNSIMNNKQLLSDFQKAFTAKAYHESIGILEQIIEASPKDPSLWHNKGIAQGLLGQFAEALRSFQAALQLAPKSIPSLTNAAMACGHLGIPDQALIYIDKGLSMASENSNLWQLRGTALGDLSRTEEAIASFSRALELDSKSTQALMKRGIARMRLGDQDGALSDFDTVTEIDENVAAGWALRGYLLKEQGEYEDALTSLDRALEADETNPNLWTSRALLLGLMGQNTEAEASARKALEFDPRNINALLYRSKALTDLGRFTEALSAVETASDLNSSAMVLALKANVLNRMGKSNEALDTARQASKLDPNSSYPWMLRAAALISMKRLPAALRAIGEAIKRKPRIPSAKKIRYEILMTMGKRRSRRAAKALRAYLQDNPGDETALNDLGGLEHRRRRFAQAAAAFAEAAQQDPDNRLYRYNQAVALISAGQRSAGVGLLKGLSEPPHSFLPARSALQEIDKLIRIWWWDWWFRNGYPRRLVGLVLLLLTGVYTLLPTLSTGISLPLVGALLNTGMSFQYYVLPASILLLLLLLPNIQRISKEGIELAAPEGKSKPDFLPLQELAKAESPDIESILNSSSNLPNEEWPESASSKA